MNKRTLSSALLTAVLGAGLLGSVSGCSNQSEGSAQIGLVDVPRIIANWPKFQNYQNQLNADMATIQGSRASDNDKRRQVDALRGRFAQSQNELTGDVAEAAKQVAGDKHLKFVFTRQYVGYGGVDITTDVEKILKIEEKATPKP